MKEKLIEKSREAFTVVNYMYYCYSKPAYKTEAVCILLCNAWELMLKSYLISRDGPEGIFYKDKQNKGRTISLNECVKKVFTNKNDMLRKYLEQIIRYRNSIVHYVNDKIDSSLMSKIEHCIVSFAVKMHEFHGIDICNCVIDKHIKDGMMKSVNSTYIYSKKNLFKEINNELEKLEIKFRIDNRTFGLIDKMYGIKENKDFCDVNNIDNTPSYKYSMKCVNFIVELIQKNPDNIKKMS